MVEVPNTNAVENKGCFEVMPVTVVGSIEHRPVTFQVSWRMWNPMSVFLALLKRLLKCAYMLTYLRHSLALAPISIKHVQVVVWPSRRQ